VADLPEDLPASVFIVLHIPPMPTSALPTILGRRARLPVAHAIEGEAIKTGRIYVAPPDRHLLVLPGRVRVAPGPRENGHRPAVDPLFRSAAVAYGPRVIGLILSGALDDGTAGLLAVKRLGGLALVQDPADAMSPSMPQSALESVEVDFCLPVSAMASKLGELVGEVEGEPRAVPDRARKEVQIAQLNPGSVDEATHVGAPSGFGCLECGGALRELRDGELFRFRCRVGHAYSPNSLLQEQAETVEEALWVALRALEERESLAHRMTEYASARGLGTVAARFTEQAEQMGRRAAVVRRLLENDKVSGPASRT
jgi:two-component system chemotaxis response regulator CheB